MKQHYFDLNLLPTAGQRKELRVFILKRSENLSLSTIDGDTIQFKVLARFMKEKFPYLYISDKLTILHGQSDHLSRRFRSLISERYSR